MAGMPAPPAAPADAMTEPAGAPVQPQPQVQAPVQPQAQFDIPEEAPIAPALDPAQAQAEINRFVEEQRAQKRMKSFIYLAIALVLAAVIGFLMWSSAQKKAKIQEAAKFFMAFRQVDDEGIAGFWKCTVRAKHRDVRLAADTLEITDGLEKAFSNFPRSQPDWLRDKCVSMIDGIVEDLGKLKPTSEFVTPLEGVKTAMGAVKITFTKYADKINQRKQEASNEQEIRNAKQLLIYGPEGRDAPKALAYFNLINCAVPDLVKSAAALKKPPDTQPVVEYIYNTCKADPKYADKLRGECFEKRNENLKKTADYRKVVYRMSGDPRDLEAINDCFRRANRGFAAAEYKEIAEVFVKYRNARGKVLETLGELKKKFAE